MMSDRRYFSVPGGPRGGLSMGGTEDPKSAADRPAQTGRLLSGIRKPGDNLCLAALSWIHILLLSGGLYLLTSLLDPATHPAKLLLQAVWLIIPAALSWVFIRVFRSLAAYLLCSAALCALLAGLSRSVLTAALAACILAMRCYVRIKKGQLKRIMMEMPGEAGAQLSRELWEIPTFLDRPSPVHWVVFAVYYIAFLLLQQDHLLRWVFLLLFADVFVCFIFGYLNSMWEFIRGNRRIANLPVHSIQKTGRILLLICAILLGLIVLPSALYGREPLTELRGLIRPVKFTPSTEFTEMMPDNFSAADLSLPGEPPADPPAWLNALTKLLMYLCTAAAAAALLIAIYRVCRNALAYFAQDEEDEILFLGTEESDLLPRGPLLRREKKERRNSPNQKIRRLYKKTIRRAIKERRTGQSPAGWETPSELESKAQLARDESTDRLHTMYEKARYSRDGCTEEDAQTISRTD